MESSILMPKGKVCVTGAGGYLGSWVVKLCLSRGYSVQGTVREPSDKKNAHLWRLDRASENLKLFKADLLDYSAMHAAIEGCVGVFHVASPVPSSIGSNPEVEVVEPAVKGTRNVMEACHEAKVKRVVVVSSRAALIWNPAWPKGKLMDETCWSDKDHCRAIKRWYALSKTEAESEAFEYGKRTGLDVVTICPSLILGPMLQSAVNASTETLLKIMREGYESMSNKLQMIVDVRDVAAALVLLFEKPEATGRYICMAHTIKEHDWVQKLKSMYPNYNYPKNFLEVADDQEALSAEKLFKLGWINRPLEETLADSVERCKQAGLLD